MNLLRQLSVKSREASHVLNSSLGERDAQEMAGAIKGLGLECITTSGDEVSSKSLDAFHVWSVIESAQEVQEALAADLRDELLQDEPEERTEQAEDADNIFGEVMSLSAPQPPSNLEIMQKAWPLLDLASGIDDEAYDCIQKAIWRMQAYSANFYQAQFEQQARVQAHMET